MADQGIAGFRLSPQQEHAWRLGAGRVDAPHRVQGVFAAADGWDVPVLRASLAALLARHEILRTTFHRLPNVTLPVQVIAESATLALEERAAADDAVLAGLLAEAWSRPLDLAAGPPLRACLVRTAGPQLLVLTLSALSADAASLRLLLAELAREYGARRAARAEPREEPAQYADVADWQNEMLEADDTAPGRDYWLHSPPPPVSRGREQDEVAPASLRAELDRDTLARLERAAEEQGGELGDLLLACWRVVLWHRRGDGEAVVGVACNGRRYAELAGAVGPLTRFLPVGGPLQDEMSLGEVVRRTRERTEEVRRWQEYFRWNREAPGAGGAAEQGEPFLAFAFELGEEPEAEPAGDTALSLVAERAWADRWEACLACTRRPQGLTLELRYDGAILDGTRAAWLLAEIQTLLHEALCDPAAAIGDLQVMGVAEREQVLAVLNATSVDFARGGRLLHQLFEEQADRRPGNLAVIDGARTLTYRELDRRANQLAWTLQGLGVGPGRPVGVIVERGAELVVALLAVLKAGGCYVPIDPDYPAERIALMLEDARPAVVVGQSHLLDRLAALPGRSLALDRDEGQISAASERRPACGADPEDVAYVLFTSGSTGRPKGAMIPHRAIVNHMLWMEEAFPLTERDRVLQKTPVSFDASVWEFYAPLQSGAALVMARPGGHRDSGYLVEVMAEQEVSVVQVVPTLLALLLAEPGLDRCKALRRVFCGGEALARDLVERFFSRLDAELHNVYGPTETTIHATAWRCRREEAGPVPIGCPIANVQVLPLTSGRQLAPIGAPGELWIGGANLGCGYLGRPDLTAERFAPDPLGRAPGGRLYRSGDLVAFRLDGALDFHGRIDHQVKLRGFRVELGEIEVVLRRHPGIAQAVAEVRHDPPGEPRLVAYWVPDSAAAPATGELRSYLLERLPEYMVPAALVRLEALPLAPNGKIDRRELPPPGEAPAERQSAYAMPRTPEEEVLAAIWSEALGVERVGIYDNFFALGADSIRAVRVVAMAKARGLHFTLADLFRFQTIADLQEELTRARPQQIEASWNVPFGLCPPGDRDRLPADVEDAYPMTSLQLGMLYHMQLRPDAPSYHNVSSFLFEAKFSLVSFQEAVDRVVARHPILRTSFDMNSYSEPMQLVHRSARLPLGYHDLRGLPPEEQTAVVDALIDRERERLFDLARPPQLRFFVHQLTETQFRFTLVENHAILDGWSLTSILREVLAIHNALVNGRGPAPEPEIKGSFREHVQLEREALASRECRDYWQGKLEGARVLRLPRRFGGVTGKVPRIGLLPVELGGEICDGLQALVRTTAVPIKDICLAGHLKALSMIGGSDDILTGLPTHGRPETVDGERIRGLFLNTVPFRFQLEDESWVEMVKRVFEAERELMPFRRYPLSAIQRNWGDKALFEVLFSFVEFHHMWSLLEQGELRVHEDYKGWEAPHYTLMCGFNRHPPVGKLSMRLYYQPTELLAEQVESYGELYRSVLRHMASRPEARHGDLDELVALRAEEIALLHAPVDVSDLEEGFSF